MKKLILIGIALLLMGSSTCPPTPIPTQPVILEEYHVYLPIAFQAEPPVYEWHSCTWDLYDKAGFQAGQVYAWIKVEYHPDGHVRLVEFLDTFYPATNIWTYFKWYARPYTHSYPGVPPYELNLLWVDPLNDMEKWGSYVESISAWEAVTRLGGSQGYTLEILAGGKDSTIYPVDCRWWVH